jgi:hypothetical protein
MTAPKRGDIVIWAEGQYLVAEVQADLLVLEGVAVIHGSSGSCRERCTVLVGDVTVVGVQHELPGEGA